MPGSQQPPSTIDRPLEGFTVGVTAARRAEELITLLRRRGAEVVHAPALRIMPLADDSELLATTRELLRRPPDVVVATTAVGFRGWIQAARDWGLDESLLTILGRSRLLARGPKVRGAIRAAGLTEEWSPASESMAEVRQLLLSEERPGRRVAVQLHGTPLPEFTEALRAAGQEVIPVPVYRWMPLADLRPVDRLLDRVLTDRVDAVTFTSAPAVSALLGRAEETGRTAPLLEALRHRLAVASVGPVTAEPLLRHQVPTFWPERFRLGPLVQSLCHELPPRARRLTVAGHRMEIRGHLVVLDGEPRPVPPAGMALLRALAHRPGWVVSRAELLRALPGGGTDEHAVETAMARLRAGLGTPGLVRTVVKRGYRLAHDPSADRAGTASG
ncbi:uroporphyrinogen-III synthase [Streptomyces sp. NPDC005438]|uniref:uroporphyrinogen-III synthase n=1 Tax=Streptomyces sp. NPDC005438 TaxID=3156880 RepID=UPI0033BAF027